MVSENVLEMKMLTRTVAATTVDMSRVDHPTPTASIIITMANTAPLASVITGAITRTIPLSAQHLATVVDLPLLLCWMLPKRMGRIHLQHRVPSGATIIGIVTSADNPRHL